MSNLIVCGTDGSAGSDRVVAVAARLGHRLQREIALVRADGKAQAFASIARARQLRELRRMASAFDLPGHARVRLAAGDPAEELVRLANELDAEFLVLGSGGRGELGSAVLGSVSAEVIRSAPCPVVVVPPDAALDSAAGKRSIVCGVDGSERDADVLRLSDDLRRRLGGRLYAVHAFDPSPLAAGAAGVAPPLLPELEETAHIRLSRALRESGVETEPTVVSLPAAVALRRVADEEAAAAFIVVGCRGHGRVARILLGSVSIQLAADATCPVVVLPPTAQLAPGSGNYELRAGAA
jgi:nucleotide-binding universal stress UspA family protein